MPAARSPSLPPPTPPSQCLQPTDLAEKLQRLDSLQPRPWAPQRSELAPALADAAAKTPFGGMCLSRPCWKGVRKGQRREAAIAHPHCCPSGWVELEKEFGLPLRQLQNYAQPLLEMETSVRGQRYARKKRGAPQDETGQYEEDDGQTAREDDDGLLQEGQDDS